MRAMVFERPGAALSYHADWPRGNVGPRDVLLRVHACGVCRTDLHVVDGELHRQNRPLIPGHEIVGTCRSRSDRVERNQHRRARRGAVARLDLRRLRLLPVRTRESVRASAVHRLHARRRLCGIRGRRSALLLFRTRRISDVAGGAAALRRADRLSRARMAGRCARGSASTASARRRTSWPRSPLSGTARVRVHPAGRHGGASVRASTRRRMGGRLGRDAARAAGRRASSSRRSARWFPPRSPRSAQGRAVVCGGIHMSDIPSFPYRLLWEERSVALGRQSDPRATATNSWRCARAKVRTATTQFPLEVANEALGCLRAGKLEGAAVLVP